MASVRRSLKNASHNFAPCERDVREATSNDRKLASAVMLARIANATYDVTTSPLVMAMLWKRLNDMGKQWRHCYKGLLLLDYLLKAGPDHIVTEVRTNLFAIESLTQFQYVDAQGVDKGINVREQAKLTLAFLINDKNLLEERERATAAHRRFSATAGIRAEPKAVPYSRAAALKNRSQVMPNGDMPPDPREEEQRQIQAAREASAAEYIERGGVYGDEPVAAVAAHQMGTPGSITALSSEEDQLAYALHISALEARSPTGLESTAFVDRRGSSAGVEMSEEEQLAMALSLSMKEARMQQASILDSDNESEGSITPPTSAYTGDYFDSNPPAYGDFLGGSEFGVTPNDAIPSPRRLNPPAKSGDNGDSTYMVVNPPDFDAGEGTYMAASEVEAYLALENALGQNSNY